MSTGIGQFAHRKFAAHETFAPRFGWLRKAYVAVSDGGFGRDGSFSDAFVRQDAPVTLGVGKNMVNAIRYWGQAFGLTVEARLEDSTSRALYARPTEEAEWMFGDCGVDPWLEQPGSLWLLHWWLLRQGPNQAGPDRGGCLAPTWWVAFYKLPSTRFTEDQLIREVELAIDAAGWESVTRASIAKDVDCLTKMYASRRAAAGSPGSVEDILDSPFRELGLLELVTDEAKTWRFAPSQRTPVPAEVVVYACLDYMSRNNIRGQITTARLAQEHGAAGRAFRLTEPALVAKIEAICARHSELKLSNALGRRSLVVDGDPEVLKHTVINAYYNVPSTRSSAESPKEGALSS